MVSAYQTVHKELMSDQMDADMAVEVLENSTARPRDLTAKEMVELVQAHFAADDTIST